MTSRWWMGCAVALFAATRAMAHDFWIEPTRFAPLPGEAVAVRLLVGQHFSGDAVARPPATSLHRFVLVDAATNLVATLPGRPGADPAGAFRAAPHSAYVIGFHGKPNQIELPADKFNAYLKDEGLDAVLAARAARGESDRPGREIYSRCAKSLVASGDVDVADMPPDRVLGFTLELVAEDRPERLHAGQSLPVRLLYEGRPLAGALVVARERDDPNAQIDLRSDADGRVMLPLSRDGEWLVKAVHMRPAPADSGADWESLWASLTFVSGAARTGARLASQ